MVQQEQQQAEYKKPRPSPADADLTEPFWQAAKRGELVMPRCRWCNKFFWYPRSECPTCLRDNWEWMPVSGRGRLHTFTIVRQPGNPAFLDDVPYVYAMVQLDEGPRMISTIIDAKVPEDIEVDMPLVAAFDKITDDWTLVKFRPA